MTKQDTKEKRCNTKKTQKKKDAKEKRRKKKIGGMMPFHESRAEAEAEARIMRPASGLPV